MRPVLAVLSAVASVIAASLCCLPISTFLLAAGSGGGATLVPPAARPWLVAFAAVMLGLGFWQAYSRKACNVPRSGVAKTMLWLSTVAIAAMWIFPQQVASLVAGSVDRAGPAAPFTTLRSVDPLRDAFNAASDETRLIALLSPT